MSTRKFTLSDILFSSPIDRTETEILLAHAIKKPREFVVAHPEYEITENGKWKMENFLRRRKDGEPLAYILGHKEFYGRDFLVTPDTLIPRPETEILVEEVLQHLASECEIATVPALPRRDAPAGRLYKKPTHEKIPFLLVDIGTGSGCIITSIVKQLRNFQLPISNFQFFGIDISKHALCVAKKNAKKFGEEKNITFRKSDLLDCFLSPASPLPPVACHLSLVANLPYVPSSYLAKEKNLLTRGLAFEPTQALDGGEDGFDLYRKLLTQIQSLKKKNPDASLHCFFEIGYDQGSLSQKEIHILFPDTHVCIIPDLSGHARVVSFSLL